MTEAAISVIVVMGVSGSGKTTVAAMLAGRLGWPYRDADDFHPPSNIAKMSAGIPLTDTDRAPWLAAIAHWIDTQRARGQHGIVACSALKRRYRTVLAGERDDVMVVFLDGARELINRRMTARRDHFMPPALLDSQFAALERPAADEGVLEVQIDDEPEMIVANIMSALNGRVAQLR